MLGKAQSGSQTIEDDENTVEKAELEESEKSPDTKEQEGRSGQGLFESYSGGQPGSCSSDNSQSMKACRSKDSLNHQIDETNGNPASRYTPSIDTGDQMDLRSPVVNGDCAQNSLADNVSRNMYNGHNGDSVDSTPAILNGHAANVNAADDQTTALLCDTADEVNAPSYITPADLLPAASPLNRLNQLESMNSDSFEVFRS